jgi:hypothetical protein
MTCRWYKPVAVDQLCARVVQHMRSCGKGENCVAIHTRVGCKGATKVVTIGEDVVCTIMQDGDGVANSELCTN